MRLRLSDVQITRCRFQSANTLECRSYFGNSPHPRFVCFALHVKNSGCLRYKSFSYLIFKLTSSAFFIRHFLCVHAIFAQHFVLKLTYANCENLTVYSVYSVYARDKELVIAHWVVFAVCNGRIVFLLGSYRW